MWRSAEPDWDSRSADLYGVSSRIPTWRQALVICALVAVITAINAAGAGF